MRARAVCSALGLAAVLALTACAAPTPPADPPASTASPSSEPSSSPDAAPTTFTQPELCAEALPAERIAEFESDRGLTLLGGPEGRYGLEYALDPSPEERAGGITCIWGFGDTDVSSVTVSVAPLGPSTRADVVARFIDQGLNESVSGDASVFWKQGDTDHEPAIVHVIRADSWISVIQTIGGPEAYDEALTLADEVIATTYR